MAETVTTIPNPNTPAPVTPPAPPEPAPEVIEAKVRERLKADYGIDDPNEIRGWKQAADELPKARQALEHVLRRPPPLAAPPSQRQPVDLEKIREWGRIDPVGAYFELKKYEDAQRAQEAQQSEQRTAQMIAHANQYQAETAASRAYLQDEFPEVFDGRTDFQKRAVEIYNSSPFYLSSGDGMRLAALQAAAEKGMPLSAKDKQMIETMNLDEKTFRAAKRARREGRGLRTES
jgi:hypothetical protein